MQERLGYEVSISLKLVRIVSSRAKIGEIKLEKFAITLKYATDMERIWDHPFDGPSERPDPSVLQLSLKHTT